jgi:hypothetical protein
MGIYINPTNMTKEAWLFENGVRLPAGAPRKFHSTANYLPVCLVDNGLFTAAGIVFS